MIEELQQAARRAQSKTIGEYALTVVEAGILITGKHSSIAGEKRHLCTWRQVTDGMLPGMVDVVAETIARHRR